jgi:hypothetical protein
MRWVQGGITDAFERRGLMQGRSDKDRFAIDQDAVTVNPSPFDVIDIIIDDKAIHGMDQLPVTDIWEKIRLHDG